MRRIGVIGCYSHDVILLLAKAVSCLGKRVYVTDRNEARVLSACRPVSEEWKSEGYTEYRGIFFSNDACKEAPEEEEDIEFVDFGFFPTEEGCGACRELIVICDMHVHHIRRIREATFPRKKVKLCMLRDVIPGLLHSEKEIAVFLAELEAEKTFYLWPDDRDIKNRYVCELQHEYSLKNASADMREAIFEAVVFLFPEAEERELRRRIRQVERREYR